MDEKFLNFIFSKRLRSFQSFVYFKISFAMNLNRAEHKEKILSWLLLNYLFSSNSKTSQTWKTNFLQSESKLQSIIKNEMYKTRMWGHICVNRSICI